MSLASSPFNASTAATHVVNAGESGKTCTVHSLVLVASGTVAVTIKDSDGNSLSGPMQLISGVPLVLPHSNRPWFTAPSGKGISITLGSGVQVSGVVNLDLYKPTSTS